MLRAVSAISLENPVLEMLASAASRRDFSKIIRIQKYSSSAPAQTVLTSEASRADGSCPASPPAGDTPPPPPPPPPPRRSWTVAAAALAVTASLGGVYFYRKLSDEEKDKTSSPSEATSAAERQLGEQGERGEEEEEVYPAQTAALPRHVHYLLVGGGTASFAAMRAIRAARPTAAVLLVGEEPLPPYMRPPLSKELWREPALSSGRDLPHLSFRQWNGKRRPLLYEPLAFYTPVERLAENGGGAAAARGWRVVRLDVVRHEAELRAPGRDPVTLSYDKCLVATGVKPRRLEALRAAREAGLAVAVRSARDAARLALLVDSPRARHVVLVGGGFLASELSAALAERLAAQGKRVTQLCREAAPLARVLPPYLAAEAARRLRAAGVRLERGAVAAAALRDGQVELRLADGRTLLADAVVECVGAEGDEALARASGLEVVEGAIATNAELQARADVWAAGDAVSWHDVALGRRRVEHHDHAVASGRRAGENMAGVAPQRPYDHQPMFWSDLGPELGYEAIGIIDSRLPTVGVFSEADVKRGEATFAAAAGGDAAERSGGGGGDDDVTQSEERRYERGVVFYTREKRVVGILLWNLFNRMHVARQVLARGDFDDLFEVAKLFTLHEEE